MKKILIISPHDVFPPKNGGERRIYLLAKELSKKNKIYFLCPFLEDKSKVNIKVNIIEVIKNKPKSKLLNFRLISRIKELNKKEDFDEIILNSHWQGINLIWLKITNGIKGYTFDDQNVEFLRFKRTGSKLWPIIYLYEKYICRFADKITCVSEVDK